MAMSKSFNIQKMVLLAFLTSIVILLQFLGAFIRFGPFSISLVLMPIVIGAALLGTYAGIWLGAVFGFIVLMSGDAAAFLAINPAVTIILVIVKGILAGFAAGEIYRLLAGRSKTVAAVAAAIVCPIVNTGVFIICCYLFFLPTLTDWGMEAGAASVTAFIFLIMVGMNFILELTINLILSPTIVRLIQYKTSTKEAKSFEILQKHGYANKK